MNKQKNDKRRQYTKDFIIPIVIAIIGILGGVQISNQIENKIYPPPPSVVVIFLLNWNLHIDTSTNIITPVDPDFIPPIVTIDDDELASTPIILQTNTHVPTVEDTQSPTQTATIAFTATETPTTVIPISSPSSSDFSIDVPCMARAKGVVSIFVRPAGTSVRGEMPQDTNVGVVGFDASQSWILLHWDDLENSSELEWDRYWVKVSNVQFSGNCDNLPVVPPPPVLTAIPTVTPTPTFTPIPTVFPYLPPQNTDNGDIEITSNPRSSSNGTKCKGYNSDGYDDEGYNCQGYNSNGYDREGYNKQGYNKQGYDREGYNKQGYNNKGCDRDNYCQ